MLGSLSDWIKIYIWPILAAIIATVVGTLLVARLQHAPEAVIPEVKGKTLEVAEAMVIGAGFTCTAEPQPGPSNNIVVDEIPSAGTKAEQGTTVHLHYQIGSDLHLALTLSPKEMHRNRTNIILSKETSISVKTESEILIDKTSPTTYSATLLHDIVADNRVVAQMGSPVLLDASSLETSGIGTFKISARYITKSDGELLYFTTTTVEYNLGGPLQKFAGLTVGVLLFLFMITLVGSAGIFVDILDIFDLFSGIPIFGIGCLIVCIVFAAVVGVGIASSLNSGSLAKGTVLMFKLEQPSVVYLLE